MWRHPTKKAVSVHLTPAGLKQSRSFVQIVHWRMESPTPSQTHTHVRQMAPRAKRCA